MGFYQYLFTGNSGSKPTSTRRDLDECLAYLRASNDPETVFTKLMGTIHHHIKDDSITIDELKKLTEFFKEQKYTLMKHKNLKNIYDLDFCNYYVLQSFFSALVIKFHDDKGFSEGARLDVQKIMDAIIENVNPGVAQFARGFKEAALAY